MEQQYSPENTSKLPAVLEMLFILGLVVGLCSLPGPTSAEANTSAKQPVAATE